MNVAELFAGTLAISFGLVGHKPTHPRTGSKGRYVTPVCENMPGITDALSKTGRLRVWANDIGVCGTTWSVISNPALRKLVIDRLVEISEEPACRELYLRLAETVPSDPIELVAVHLVLERWSFGGKPVYIKDGRFCTPGYNKSSAEGIEAKSSFGAVRPQLPSLIERLRNFPEALEIYGSSVNVDIIPGHVIAASSKYILIDAPYRDVTGYGHDVDWNSLIITTLSLSDSRVLFCSDKREEQLVAAHWKAIEPTRTGKKTTLGKKASEEWMHFSPGCRAR